MKNKTKEFIKETSIVNYIIIFIISVILFFPFISIDILNCDDGLIHIARIVEVGEMLKEGVGFPPAISTHFCNGFGYAINLFYSPLVTYLPLLLKTVVENYSIALKSFTLFTIVISGITMYHFTAKVTKNKMNGLIAGILYITAPYHITDIYTRFALGEFAAFMFIPLVFLGLYNLFEEDGKKHYLISIGAIGLILTHSITLVYTMIFSIIYILFNIKKLKERKVIIVCIINAIFIISITLFFTIPLIEHKVAAQYTIFDSKLMLTNVEFVYNQTIDIERFFVNEPNTAVLKIGIPTIIFLILTLFIFPKIDTKYKKIYIIFILFSFVCLFMCTKYFFWKILPDFLAIIQYPWRMLGFATFFLSFVCAVNIYMLIELMCRRHIKIKTMCVYIILILLTVNGVLIINECKKIQNDTITDIVLEGDIKDNKLTNPFHINREYLPIKAAQNGCEYIIKRPKDTYILLNGELNAIFEQKEGLKYNLEFSKPNVSTEIELPYMFYLGYDITLENNTGEKAQIDYEESDNGFIKIALPSNVTEGKINLEFTGTVLTKIAYIISIISLIVGIVIICRRNVPPGTL